ncbi:YbhB/YbcL family Raf kinase inhibitor-like protein [Oceanidesulfovibrio marinus]|uniref:Kinase inhibitor n=1 Tax=Oceanidesulfovibrio marinus TaxID=370038 RepID=A0A6P1Z9Y5_9BACT|nr:YbhB/YbcL family Raf kinase inhibitor-like protein [Oceanidesulfovibrio marinus]QJT10457.1 YbhB/YbcL family Raf kinase inhibitor-like protein [Oceanidesulfovibrio marinus]TVM30339.1 kinase inhibitor [Oceanidesulfovibrio marinus]
MRAIITLILVICLAVPAWAGGFTLKSPDISEGQPLPNAQVLNNFGCTGENISPALEWSDPPEGAKSFAVTVFDPDAPRDGGWWHWVVFNIPATARSFPAGAGSGQGLPKGAVQARNDYGSTGYGGACPPPGPAHRYVFTVHALDMEKLDLAPDSSAAMVGFMMKDHTLAKASITTTYGR